MYVRAGRPAFARPYVGVHRSTSLTSSSLLLQWCPACLANASNQAETLLHSLEQAAAGISLHVNAHKTEYMCFNQTGDISTLDGSSLKLVDKFTYLGSSVSSTEKDIDTRLTKAWTAIEKLSIHYLDANKTAGEKAGRQLHKNTASNIEQVLAATPHKTPTIRPPTPITKTIQVRRTRMGQIELFNYSL